jgi:hypothetical protein
LAQDNLCAVLHRFWNPMPLFGRMDDNPGITWITQQARQVVWNLKDDSRNMTFLIHDNDTKFTSSYEMCFLQKGLKSFIPRTGLPKQMLLQNGGYARFGKRVSIVSWFWMKTTFAAFSKSMGNITTIPARIRA